MTIARSAAPAPEVILERFARHLANARGYAALEIPEGNGVRQHGACAGDDFPWRTIAIPELVPLAAHFDRILVRGDGYTLDVACIKNRDVGGPVTVGLSRLVEVGRSCLRYTGTVHGTQMPVVFTIYEAGAGPVATGHLRPLRRLAIGTKVSVNATALRLDGGPCWTNAPLGGLGQARRMQRLIERLVRGEDPVAPSARVGAGGPAVVTVGLVALLVAVFAVQLALGSWSGLLSPSVRSLIAAGGLTRQLVTEEGQWYRLVSAGFLHAGLIHLVMNGLALFLGGWMLERLVGRAWFAAIYGLALLGGSLASVLFNGTDVVSVGASGAIMGVLAAGFFATARLPYGQARTSAQIQLLYRLIPALIPVATHHTGGKIDFAAHLGGALSGGILGLLLLRAWAPGTARPGWAAVSRGLAAGLALVACVAIAKAYAAWPALQREADVQALVAPDARFKGWSQLSASDQVAAVDKLEAEFPHDPRTSLFAALTALDEGAHGEAEAHLRRGLGERLVLSVAFPDGKLERAMRGLLARSLLERGEDGEAREVFRSSCGAANEQLPAGLTPDWVASVCTP